MLFSLIEALNAPGCDAIHITEVETPVEFDTFFAHGRYICLSIMVLVLSHRCTQHPVTTYVRVGCSVVVFCLTKIV